MSQATPTRPASTPNSRSNTGSSFEIPAFIFDDLCSRFIINIPEEERQDLIRIFFQIELAHWFYLDFYCQENPELKACGIKDFSAQIFRHCPTLIVHADNVDEILESWRGYKMAVPTYGAIMLDPTYQHCLLVQGYWSKANWGFPKGKVNEDEEAAPCAVREVYEETGFDIGDLIRPTDFLEFKMNEQISRLYIITGVPMDTQFAPRTRKEIRKLKWFRIDQLPAHKKDVACKTHFGLPPNAFFMVIPFVKPLRKWIARRLNKTPDGNGDASEQQQQQQQQQSQSAQKPRHKSGGADMDLHSQHNQGRRRSKSQCADHSENGVQISDKQRQKQKQYFQQQIQNEYQEYQNYKSPNKTPKPGRDQRTRSASPGSHTQKGSANRHQTASPKNKKHMQILKRDGTVSGTPSRKNLSAQFQDAGNQGNNKGNNTWKQQKNHSNINKEPGSFSSNAWLNFSLDIDAVMSAFPKLTPPDSRQKSTNEQRQKLSTPDQRSKLEVGGGREPRALVKRHSQTQPC